MLEEEGEVGEVRGLVVRAIVAEDVGEVGSACEEDKSVEPRKSR